MRQYNTPCRKIRGITLVELLVGVAMLTLITATSLRFFANLNTMNSGLNRELGASADLDDLMTQISQDVSMRKSVCDIQPGFVATSGAFPKICGTSTAINDCSDQLTITTANATIQYETQCVSASDTNGVNWGVVTGKYPGFCCADGYVPQITRKVVYASGTSPAPVTMKWVSAVAVAACFQAVQPSCATPPPAPSDTNDDEIVVHAQALYRRTNHYANSPGTQVTDFALLPRDRSLSLSDRSSAIVLVPPPH